MSKQREEFLVNPCLAKKRVPSFDEVAARLGIPAPEIGNYQIHLVVGQGGRDREGDIFYDEGFLEFFWETEEGRKISRDVGAVALLFGGSFGPRGKQVRVGPLALKLGISQELLREAQEWWDREAGFETWM